MKIDKLIRKYHIRTNSNDIKKGDIFVCTLGLIDKNKFITDALKNGASLIITNKKLDNKIPHIRVDDIDLYFKNLLDIKYHFPLLDKKLIGITGTDGKTTTTTIIRDMLDGASIGTNGLEFYNFEKSISNTTPSLDYLYEYFDIINKNKIDNIVMEVSSESYLTKRIPYLKFDVGIFLNISKEHLDKHKSFNNYLECKKELLKNSSIKIINKDSKYFKEITSNLDNYLTFGKKKCDLRIINYTLYEDKTDIILKYLGEEYHIESKLIGSYNVYNLCAAILCLISLGYEINDIIKRVDKIQLVKGRMEKLIINNKKIILDYAHTIKATKEVLCFMDKFYHNKIITVVGCAGGRYKEKRKFIGKIVLDYSKMVYFTTDDPRWENPKDIIKDMINNYPKNNYRIVINREQAIKEAISFANKDDIVIILGKGRDNYMAIKDKKIIYSDYDILKKL